MDYSLLIGIHDVIRGNTEGIRDNNLHVVTVSGLSNAISLPISTNKLHYYYVATYKNIGEITIEKQKRK
jgi:hypothetical protein